VDASAWVKLYVEEANSAACEEMLRSDPDWVCARHAFVEVRRNLARHLPAQSLAEARQQFELHWSKTHVVELDRALCEAAAQLAEITGVRTLDALHLAGVQRAGVGSLPLLTYDLRQAQAARSLGWPVLGV